jgi:hypothetical protein
MSLRAWLAGQALAGIAANPVIGSGVETMKRDLVSRGMSAMDFQENIEFPAYAKACIAIADAVLAELERTGK